MRRRYILRRSDNYPIIGNVAATTSGSSGTYKVTTGFTVTSAIVAHTGAFGSSSLPDNVQKVVVEQNFDDGPLNYQFTPTEPSIFHQAEFHFSRHATLRDFSVNVFMDNALTNLYSATDSMTEDFVYADPLVLESDDGDYMTFFADIAGSTKSSSSSSESSSSSIVSTSSMSSLSSSSTQDQSTSSKSSSSPSSSSSSPSTSNTSDSSTESSSSTIKSTSSASIITSSSSSASSTSVSTSSSRSSSSSSTEVSLTSSSSVSSSSTPSSVSSKSSSSKSSSSSESSSSESSTSSPSSGLSTSSSSESSSSGSSSSCLHDYSSSSKSSLGSSQSSSSSESSSSSSISSSSESSSSSCSSLGDFRVTLELFYTPVNLILQSSGSSSVDDTTAGTQIEVTQYLDDGFVISYDNAPSGGVIYFSYMCM